MCKEVRVFMLAITASIFLNWVAPATVFADEPISVGPRVQPPNPQQAKAQSQPEQLRADPASALGARLIQLPALGQASVKSQMTQPPAGPTKIGFAREIPELTTQQNTQTLLEWKPVSGGMLGSLAISSPGAAALRMGIKIQSLPDAAELRFFSDRATEIQKVSGKTINELIRLNIKAGDPEETAWVYWSPVINGEIIGLEVFLPEGTSQDKVEISVPSVSHIEISPLSDLVSTQDFGDSGACNLDVMCNANWQDTSNSVARMLYTKSGQSYWCTGTLLNDVGGTYTPYFLSANHCISTQSAASTLQTYWFYHSTACNSGILNQNYATLTQGATLLFNTATTDASFMRLNGTLPNGLVFSGWTTETPSIGTNLTGVHNPQGDMQKISYGSVTGYQVCTDSGNSTFSCSPSNASSGTFLQVVFSQGITEGGSSGSGIFPDTTKRLTGQLYGGNTSCATPNSPTYYGRFDKTYALGNLGQWLAYQQSGYAVSISPDSHDYGNTNTGQSSSKVFTISNTGTGAVTFKSGHPFISSGASPNPFTISTKTCGTSLPAGNSCSVTVSFSPTLSGLADGLLFANVNEMSTNIISAIRGTGVGSPIINYLISIINSAKGTVTSSPAGINCGSTCSASFNSGTSVALSATPDTNYAFTGWSGDCSGTGVCTLTMSSNKSVSATFTYSPPAPTNYLVTVSNYNTAGGTITSNTGKINCGTLCSGSYSAGFNETLYPNPSAGYTFAGWTGDCFFAGTGPCNLAINTNKIIGASFTQTAPSTYLLSVGSPLNGTINSLPAGISCTPVCSASFNSGTLVTLTATSDAGYTFSGWTGACSGSGGCFVTMNSSKNVTATFTYSPPAPASFNLAVTKAGGGSVSSQPSGIDCGSTCSGSFSSGATIILVALPDNGFEFSGWSGACSGAGNCSVLMDGDKAVSANFVEVPTYPVTVTKQSGGVVSSQPQGIVCGGSSKQCKAQFSSVNLTATSNAGFEFIKWVGCQDAEENVCSLQPTKKTTVKAVFKALPKYKVTIVKNKLGAITSTPGGLKCSDKKTKCSVSFIKGTEVTLTPISQEGRTFTGWTGACSGFDPCTLTLDGNKGVGATFQ